MYVKKNIVISYVNRMHESQSNTTFYFTYNRVKRWCIAANNYTCEIIILVRLLMQKYVRFDYKACVWIRLEKWVILCIWQK